ncbi:hypothetical protein [Flavobacterium sp.]|uniref:hypothetical protein n=1 Tax=Flavobacterium sp. TaxID=239 RepID=UPI004048E559
MKYLLILFSIFSYTQNQKFIPVDEETLEFIGEVKYTLHLNKKPIFTSLTSKDTITKLPNNVVFDSISFSKFNYKQTGLKKENLNEVVLLDKTVYELDEVVVVGSEQKEISIGEKARFVKRSSRMLMDSIDYGLLFHEFELKNKQIKKLLFFIEKVKYKTTYKIMFFSAQEIGNPLTYKTLQIKDTIFESPILTLEKGAKNEVIVDLQDYNIDMTNKNIFVCIQLENYYDENNNIIKPEAVNKTKLKFQLSKKLNYYEKMAYYYTNELTKELININQMINYDFANKLFVKPHRSILVAPAILLKVVNKN